MPSLDTMVMSPKSAIFASALLVVSANCHESRNHIVTHMIGDKKGSPETHDSCTSTVAGIVHLQAVRAFGVWGSDSLQFL